MPNPSELERQGEPPAVCTGISARWCQFCGDCTCRDPGDLNDEDCPLHSPSSPHGEATVFETLWGPVVLYPE